MATVPATTAAIPGGAIWTTNFDTLIENAVTPSLPVVAWPDDPTPGAAVRNRPDHSAAR